MTNGSPAKTQGSSGWNKTVGKPPHNHGTHHVMLWVYVALAGALLFAVAARQFVLKDLQDAAREGVTMAAPVQRIEALEPKVEQALISPSPAAASRLDNVDQAIQKAVKDHNVQYRKLSAEIASMKAALARLEKNR